jgi:hypothetical protein
MKLQTQTVIPTKRPSMKSQAQTVIPAEHPSMKLHAQTVIPTDRHPNPDRHPNQTVIPTGASRLFLPHSLPANGSARGVEESLFDVCRPAIILSNLLELSAVDRKPFKEPEITPCP